MGGHRTAAAIRHSVGRPRLSSLREVVNGIFYVLRGGVPWRLLPKDLPPKSTVYGYFSTWSDSGLFAGINHHLVMLDCERVGRDVNRHRNGALAQFWCTGR